jgi:hypothetical protein
MKMRTQSVGCSKGSLRGKFISMSTHIRKAERFQFDGGPQTLRITRTSPSKKQQKNSGKKSMN